MFFIPLSVVRAESAVRRVSTNHGTSFLEPGHLVRGRLARCLLAFSVVILGMAQQVLAEKMELTESYTNDQVYVCQATVSSKGKVFFSKSETEEDRESLTASAKFAFSERRLLPAGREALAFRSLRDFQSAEMTTLVADHPTEVKLLPEANLIVSSGYREGVRHYSPNAKLNRDSLDLLELPGDPLVLAALLPLNAVEVDDEWKPSDWVMQMLTAIEAVESSELSCKLTAANTVSAKVNFSGKIKGQRYGAATEVGVKGSLIFDLRTSHIARAQASYTIQADVGTVYPGLDIVVTSDLTRSIATAPGRLTEALAESIPLDPREGLLDLQFRAPEWGVELTHGRGWHLYNVILQGSNPVAIFRLVEHGSLVAQCNVSPLLKAAPGQTVPIEQFEADIQQSLGKSFKEIADQETLKTPDNRQVFRVVAKGEQEIKGKAGSALIPMTWIYYLVSDPTGRQLSFVFSVESPLVEQLNQRDLEMVKQQKFFEASR